MSENEPGAVEKAKGLAKEAAGAVMGDEEMKAEGAPNGRGTPPKDTRITTGKS